MERDIYGQGFKRARLEASVRLVRHELEDREEAAREIGVSASMLKQIETGARRPGWETLEAMAKTYNVLPGDLLPSMAPKGAEVDRILGPLMTMPERSRQRFITQMEAFARMLAAEITATIAEEREFAANANVVDSTLSLVQPDIYVDSKQGRPYSSPSTIQGGDGPKGDVPGVAWARKPAVRAAHVERATGEGRAAEASSRAKKDAKKR